MSSAFSNRLRGSFASMPAGVLHLYCDGTLGSDANDGRTAATPKKTLSAVAALVPQIITAHVVVHLSGTFTEDPACFVARPKGSAGSSVTRLVIDGGSDLVGLAGPWTADISSISSIGLSSLTETPDVHSGFFVEILDGPAAGTLRGVSWHNATTFAPDSNFPVDPGNAQFRIVRPATCLQSSSAMGGLSVETGAGGSTASFQVAIQRIYTAGTTHQVILAGLSGGFTVASTVLASTSANVLDVSGLPRCQFTLGGSMIIDPDNPDTLLTKWPGLSVRGGNTHIAGGLVIPIPFYASGKLYVVAAPMWANFNNYRAKWAQFRAYQTANSRFPAFFDNLILNAGSELRIENPSGVGVFLKDGFLSIKNSGTLVIQNCGSHGIETVNGFLELVTAISGSGNTGAGVYAHSGSVVHTKSGSPPTLTGTVGDLSTDGSTQKSTWAAIEAGTPVADTAEMVVAKKV